MVERWVSSYVGLTYKSGGRTRNGLDCWGLVRLVLAEQCNLSLPSHTVTIDIEKAVRRAVASADWFKVEQPKAFDVVVMLTHTAGGREAPLHVGVMVSTSHVLHVDEGLLSAAVPLRHPFIASRLFGFYRHKTLT